MADYSQKVTSSFNERMRLNRVRRRKESLRFWDEFRIIPRWVIALVVVLFLIAQGIALLVNLTAPERGDQIFPPELSEHGHIVLASFALAGLVTLMSIFFTFFIFLVAYVNRDASRRGMNAPLWTILILIFFPTWGLIGLVIYFLMREPLPYPCPQCSTSVSARFNFCPNCKCNLQPSCPQCKKEVGELDKFCPYCGTDLMAAGSAGKVLQSPAS
jgi:hypothetical protein